MKLKRFIKSLINSFLFIINAILWIFNIDSLGELATKIKTGQGKKQKAMYGLFSLLQYFSYGCIIGLVFTIIWWYKGETSIAEKLSGLKMEPIVVTPAPTNADNQPFAPTPASTSENTQSPTSPDADGNPTPPQNPTTFQG